MEVQNSQLTVVERKSVLVTPIPNIYPGSDESIQEKGICLILGADPLAWLNVHICDEVVDILFSARYLDNYGVYTTNHWIVNFVMDNLIVPCETLLLFYSNHRVRPVSMIDS